MRGRHQIYVQEYGRGVKGQVKIEDYPTDADGNIRIGETKVDSETGEVLN